MTRIISLCMRGLQATLKGINNGGARTVPQHNGSGVKLPGEGLSLSERFSMISRGNEQLHNTPKGWQGKLVNRNAAGVIMPF